MMQPDLMVRRAGVGDAAAEVPDPVEQPLVPEGGAMEIGSILPPAAGDDIVAGREGEALMVAVAVRHRFAGRPCGTKARHCTREP